MHRTRTVWVVGAAIGLAIAACGIDVSVVDGACAPGYVRCGNKCVAKVDACQLCGAAFCVKDNATDGAVALGEGGGVTPLDSGADATVDPDGGAIDPDGGPNPDGGAIDPDGGPSPDGGAIDPDGGPNPDGGAIGPDGGAPDPDGGAIGPDGGAPDPDGGAIDPDAAPMGDSGPPCVLGPWVDGGPPPCP